MGTYTAAQKYYLIDPEELVGVDQDLNYNLNRADIRLKPLLQWQKTDVPSLTNSSLPKETGFKWYKTYSNSMWVYAANPTAAIPIVRQDPNSQVSIWSTSGLAFEPGYSSIDLEENRTGYSVSDGMVRWRGRVHLASGAELPLNTVVNFLTPPTSVLPNVARYFFVAARPGAFDDVQLFRVFIPNSAAVDKRMEFIKYGGNGVPTNYRYVPLTGISYPLSDV